MLNSLRKFWALPICSQSQNVSIIFLQCLLPESPSKSSVVLLYPKFLRIFRVNSPLLIVLSDREGSHWVLAVLPFIQGLWLYSIQWEWGNLGVIYNLLEGMGIFIHLSHWDRAYLRPTSIIGRILPSSNHS